MWEPSRFILNIYVNETVTYDFSTDGYNKK